MKNQRTFTRVFALLLALLMLAGCSSTGGDTSKTDAPSNSSNASDPVTPSNTGDTPTPTPTPTNTVLKLSIGEQYGKDQIKSCWTEAAGLLFTSVWSAMVKFNEDGTDFYGDLAESYEISDDGLTYTFHIRDDVVWHDGEPFTVDDIVWSIRTYLRAGTVTTGPKTAISYCEGAADYIASESEELPGVYADGQDVIFKLYEPYGDFMTNIASFRPLPKHLLEDEDPLTLHTCSFWQNPVGNGPYKIKEFQPGSYIVIEINEDYYGATPGIPEIQFLVYGDVQAQASLQNGEIAMYEFDNVQAAENIVNQNSDLEIIELKDALYFRFLTANLTGGDSGYGGSKVADPRIREAVFRAIDKASICEDLFEGGATPMTTMVPATRPEYNADAYSPAYDMDEAARLLEEAGYDFSQPIRIAYFYDDQDTIDAMDVIKHSLEQLGLTVELTYLSGELVDLIYNIRDYDFIYQGLSTALIYGAYNFHNPGTSFEKILGTSYQDTWTDLIYRYRTTLGDERQEALNEMQAHESETLEIYPLWSYTMYEVVNPTILEFPGNFQSGRNFERHFEDWHLVQ